MSAKAVITVAATVIYVAVSAVVAFGPGLFGGSEFALLSDYDGTQPVGLYADLLNVGLGLLVGRWWAVLLPVLPCVMPFLPGVSDERPYADLAVLFGVVFAVQVAAGVGARKLCDRARA